MIRSLGVSAVKGNRLAQRAFAEMIGNLEAEEHASKLEYFGAAIEYQRAWQDVIRRCREAGKPVPDPVPHPDDMTFDLAKAEVIVDDPMTEKQKQELNSLLARRDDAQAEINFLADTFRRAKDPRRNEMLLRDWHAEQYIFDIINDRAPKRLKAELKNRSYAEGASRAGKALGEYRSWVRERDQIADTEPENDVDQ